MTDTLKDYLDSKRLYYLYIPPGATHILQPLDVVINKPLKQKVKSLYVNWLEKCLNQKDSKFLTPPSIEQILEWCTNAIESIVPPLIFKAFEATGILRRIDLLSNRDLLTEKVSLIVQDYLTIAETTLNED